MLKINGVVVSDLREDGALVPHAVDIAGAFESLVANSGEDPLEEPTKQDVMARLVLWSHDGAHSFVSWKAAVRSAFTEVTQGGGALGTARLGLVQERGEKNFRMAMASVNWANCGKTSANILQGLVPSVEKLAEAIRTAVPKMFAAGDGERLTAMLREIPKPGTVLLFDCTMPQVHTFLVEVHPNGARYLCQSYQGAYYASWWTGKDNRGLRLTVSHQVPQEDIDRLREMRLEYGHGRIIGSAPYLRMVDALAAGLGAATPTPVTSAPDNKSEVDEHQLELMLARQAWEPFARLWLKLPFCPTKEEALSVASRGGRPTIQVTRYEIPDLSKGTADSITVPIVPEVIEG